MTTRHRPTFLYNETMHCNVELLPDLQLSAMAKMKFIELRFLKKYSHCSLRFNHTHVTYIMVSLLQQPWLSCTLVN